MTKGRSPKAPPSRSALLSVAEGLRMLTSLCTGGYPRIVRREGRICRCFWGLVVSNCGMAHRLRVIWSAVVARHYGIVDGKRRRTHCTYQQRRGGKHGHYSLYSTQHTLLTLSFPSRVFTHPRAGMVRCEKAGTPRRIPRPGLYSLRPSFAPRSGGREDCYRELRRIPKR